MEEDQKYGHFTPGTISQTLRTALGLRNNQLPPYIYKMRVCGYPPGWLEEAKFFYSNLHMFDPDGKTVRQNDVKKKQGLDRDKIFDYPGFNSPLEDHIKDVRSHLFNIISQFIEHNFRNYSLVIE